MKIIPTIFEKRFERAEEKIEIIAPMVTWLQVDVIDAIFTVGKTFELELLATIEPIFYEKILWETHLMVKEPIKWIEKCLHVNSSRIIGQVEMMDDREKFVEAVKDSGAEVGLGFDVETTVTDIPLETDLILLMARKAGFEERPFETKKVLEKINTLQKLLEINKNYHFEIGVDGGIDREKIEILKEAGADTAYCGSAIFNGKVEDNWQQLQKLL